MPEVKSPNLENWFGDRNEGLKGFSWRAGTVRDTTGITFWSDAFLHDAENGEKLAIILVDSQGLFDNETSTGDNSNIFSLSTLLSSHLILNISGLMQEDQLQYLQFATNFATYNSSSESHSFKPFQNFCVLIRDWSNPDEFEFGLEGGKKYLDELLQVKPNQNPGLQSVRKSVRGSFEQIICCLLPYPGKAVARFSNYDGRWSLMDEDFIVELKQFIPELLKPEKLIAKKINNIEVTGGLMNDYFQQYVSMFQSNQSPRAESIYETTIEKFMNNMVESSFDSYKKKLKSPQNENEIQKCWDEARDKTLREFETAKKMGTREHSTKYREILLKKIENHFIEFHAVSVATISKLKEEQNRKLEAERFAERIALAKIEEERKVQAIRDQLAKETRKREEEIVRRKEELRLKELEIQRELERQRVAEEQRQRELAEQRRIEEERQRIEEEERRRREEQERQNKILFRIRVPHVNVDVPKPKCLIM